MHIVIAAVVGFIAGVVLTLIFRIQVETKLKAEKAALIAAAKAKF